MQDGEVFIRVVVYFRFYAFTQFTIQLNDPEYGKLGTVQATVNKYRKTTATITMIMIMEFFMHVYIFYYDTKQTWLTIQLLILQY